MTWGHRIDPPPLSAPAVLCVGACERCGEAVRVGANYCARCGAPLMTPAAFAPATVSSPPRPSSYSVPARRRKGRLRPIILWVGAAALIVHLARTNARPGAHPNNPLLNWGAGLLPSRLIASPPPLPAAPDARLPLSMPAADGHNAVIERSWVDLTDHDGHPALAIYAHIFGPRKHGLRLVAHVEYAGGGAVEAVDAAHRDADGQAAAAVEVPATPGVVRVTAWMPLTSMALPPVERVLTVTTALFDEDSRPIATGLPVSFKIDPLRSQ